ncbi:MAG: type II secretion system F family protein [Pseudomonadota bacterium]
MLDTVLGQGFDSTTLILGVAFACGVCLFLGLSMVLSPALKTRARVSEQLREAKRASRRALSAGDREARADAAATIHEQHRRMEKAEANALATRLTRAGFYGSSAPKIFAAIRLGVTLAAFLALYALGEAVLPGVAPSAIAAMAFIFALAFLIVPNFVLDALGDRRMDACRRGFPAMLDLLIVCSDAGLSLEAAIERIADEIVVTNKPLGTYLRLMTLELRAGRSLSEALDHFARRLDFDEAKMLAVLFKQSEELGTSLVTTLRVAGAEMREKRVTAAEEKANALPVKMILPLGLFVFPMILVVVMLPVIVRLRATLF